MRAYLLASAMLSLTFFASGAEAMNSVTNLDKQPHRVVLESVGGATHTLEIPAQQTVRFNEYRANLYLKGEPERSQPSRMGDQFVIWEDGRLRLQRRQYQRFNQ